MQRDPPLSKRWADQVAVNIAGGMTMARGARSVDDDLEVLRRRARAFGITVHEVLHHTDKAIVAAGRRGDSAVVAKLLTSAEPYWRSRQNNEIAVYAAFSATPPPVRAPELVDHDGQGLLVLSWLTGQRLCAERHTEADVTGEVANAILAALTAISSWQAPTALRSGAPNYADRVRAEHAAGMVSDDDRRLLLRLVRAGQDWREMQHGDPIPANLLLHNTECGLVDWEHAGMLMPGWDLAVLLTVCGHASPTLRAAVARSVADRGIEAPFLVSMSLVLAREIRMHSALPQHDRFRRRRLAGLHRAQRKWRQRLRELG